MSFFALLTSDNVKLSEPFFQLLSEPFFDAGSAEYQNANEPDNRDYGDEKINDVERKILSRQVTFT
jgi:hypothetical protein